MKSLVLGLLVTGALIAAGVPAGRLSAAESNKPMLSHDVFFSLTDNSAEAKEKLVVSCKKYLSEHPGVVWFAAGPLAPEFQREVNDRDFDVALHIVFKDKAAHDTYQTSEKHQKFIEENEKTFGKVRVFDSYVSVSSHGEVDMKAMKPAKKGEGKRKKPTTAEAVVAPGPANP